MENFSAVRSYLQIPLGPFQYFINLPTQIISDIKTIFRTHQSLIEENLKLREQQLVLKTQLQRLVSIESENNYLKSLLQSSRQVKNKTLIAELLAVDAEPFVSQVILDRGSRDNVYVGQPVLDATGVMGQVIQVGPMTSRVLLINDPHSGISAQNARNGIRSIAVGDTYTGKLRLMYMPKTADIRPGDLFVTSGLGDFYPEGYPIGKVASVTKDPGHQFATIIIEPSAKLDSSRQVLLIWYQKNA